MLHILTDLIYVTAATIWDVLPIVVIIFGFQLFILRKPIPNLKRIATGFALVLLGLGFFLEGLEAALFPLGKLMAQQLTDPRFHPRRRRRTSPAMVGILLGLPFRLCHRLLHDHRRAVAARGRDQS